MPEKLRTGRTYTVGVAPGGPFFQRSEEISVEEVSRRIAKLARIRSDLESAVVAVTALQVDADEKQKHRELLRQSIAELSTDKTVAEALLRVPEESFSRLLARASQRGRLRGVVEGLAGC